MAQLVPWRLSEKSQYLRIATSKLTEINGIQKPRLHSWHWHYVSFTIIFFNLLQTRALFRCTFFSRTPCIPSSFPSHSYTTKNNCRSLEKYPRDPLATLRRWVLPFASVISQHYGVVCRFCQENLILSTDPYLVTIWVRKTDKVLQIWLVS